MLGRLIAIKHVQFFTRCFTIATGSLRTWGTGTLPEWPYIVASNHQSYMDPVLHGVVLGPIRYMARKTLFRNPIFGRTLRFVGAIELDRDQGADLAAIRKLMEILKMGQSLLLFPEGTRTLDGSLGKMMPGAGIIAARAGVPVVPAVIDGAYKAWPRGQLLPKVRPIQLAYGRPLTVERKNVRGFQDQLTEAIKGLLRRVRKTRF
ncbi:MAG: 1-acyl-sn-glycerol-3-phosphate acyltransferase [Planctomycetota bacterium]|nr:MAG: 1-acyl-sn-glycerol-3-phosphate acyltransferase [Planctomycetota bacterium]